MHVYTGRQCNQPMGLQSGRLKNHLVTASSQWDKYHAAFLARLHWQRRGRYMGAWSARHNNRYQWLQLDFGRWAKIIRLATQGRQDTDQWVTQYYVRHSLDGIRFVDYQERNTRKVGTQYQGSVKRLGKLWSGIGVRNTVTRCSFLLVHSLYRLADLSCRLVNLLYSLITSTQDDRLRRQDDKISRQDERSKRQDGITVDNTTYFLPRYCSIEILIVFASLPYAAFFEALFAFKTLSRHQSHTQI